MPKQKAAEPLFEQLSKTLETDGEDLVSKLKVFGRVNGMCLLFACILCTNTLQVKQSANLSDF